MFGRRVDQRRSGYLKLIRYQEEGRIGTGSQVQQIGQFLFDSNVQQFSVNNGLTSMLNERGIKAATASSSKYRTAKTFYPRPAHAIVLVSILFF